MLFSELPNKFLLDVLIIYFTDPPHEFDCWIMLATAVVSDVRRASSVVNGEKLAELNDGRSTAFTIAGRFTGASSVSSENRGNSCGLNMFLSQDLLPI